MVGWMVGRRCPGRKQVGMIRFAGDAASNARGGSMRDRSRRPGRHAWGGRRDRARQDLRSALCNGLHGLRDAARDAPGPACHTPKTPVGRRGASLVSFADYPRGASASPAPLLLCHPPGSM